MLDRLIDLLNVIIKERELFDGTSCRFNSSGSNFVCLHMVPGKFGVRTMTMKDDGTCHFRSMAFKLLGDQEHHALVRSFSGVTVQHCHAHNMRAFSDAWMLLGVLSN